MTLETCAASAAGENERGQHGQRCKNPLHVSLPSPGSHVSCRASTLCPSGGLVGDLRGYLGPTPRRHESAWP